MKVWLDNASIGDCLCAITFCMTMDPSSLIAMRSLREISDLGVSVSGSCTTAARLSPTHQTPKTSQFGLGGEDGCRQGAAPSGRPLKIN